MKNGPVRGAVKRCRLERFGVGCVSSAMYLLNDKRHMLMNYGRVRVF